MSDSDATDGEGATGATDGEDSEEADVLREAGLGFAAGVIAWILGYAVSYLLWADDLRDGGTAVDVGPLEWDVTVEAVGWVFYNAHFVETNVPTVGPLGPRGVDVLSEVGGGAAPLFYLVPVALLLAAGYGAATLARGIETPSDGARVGAFTVAGYLPLSAIGIAFFTASVGEGLVRPQPATALILAGLAYPLIVGTVGGLLRGYVVADT